MHLFMYGDGAHVECIHAGKENTHAWCKRWGVTPFIILGGAPLPVNGGDLCFKKIWAIKEILGFTNEPTPYQMEHGMIAEGDLCIYCDVDGVLTQHPLADPKRIEEALGKADITCLFHPSVEDAAKNGMKRCWMNLGFFAFRNTQKMRDYFQNAWYDKAPYIEDLTPEVAAVVRQWYLRRWTKGTDEMRISKDVNAGILTAAELDIRWNVCWPLDRTKSTDEEACFFRHWAWEPDKNVVVRRMKEMLWTMKTKWKR
jgi:hypothetical protein